MAVRSRPRPEAPRTRTTAVATAAAPRARRARPAASARRDPAPGAKLPLARPYPPMEARSVDRLPTGAQWQYEPKWDGFRCLAFRNGDVVQLQSKAGEPLERYFPELVDALRAVAAPRFVLDGEIVIPKGSFNDLQLRIHPAESRILKLAAATPAQLVVFDLLVDQKGELVAERALAHRRALLELFAERHLPGPRFALSPATCDPRIAQQWAEGAHGVLDGVIA